MGRGQNIVVRFKIGKSPKNIRKLTLGDRLAYTVFKFCRTENAINEKIKNCRSDLVTIKLKKVCVAGPAASPIHYTLLPF